MGRRYTEEERHEALKLADEIDGAAAARRLGIKVDRCMASEAGRNRSRPRWRKPSEDGVKPTCWQRTSGCACS